MKWKFWQKEQGSEKRETFIKISKRVDGNEIYVGAQSTEEALKLYKKLKKEVGR